MMVNGDFMVCPDCKRLILSNKKVCWCKNTNLQYYDKNKLVWDIKELEENKTKYAVIKQYNLF